MATQGYNSPGTQVGAAWANPGNAATVNATNATNNNNPPAGPLALTNYGFTIPAGTIDGIEVESTAAQNSGLPETTYNIGLQLTKTGTGVGSAVTVGLSGTPLQTNVSGGATSLWGTTWTTAEINASTFGVILEYSGDAGNTNDLIVDCVRIKIYYTATGGGAGVAQGLFSRRPAINVKVN